MPDRPSHRAELAAGLTDRADTPPSARKLARDRTVALCLDAARRLFTEKTYEEVTIRDLARAMDMSTGAVFANFRDKADVWRCAMLCEPPVDSPLTRAAGPMRAALMLLSAVRPTNWEDDDDPAQLAAWRACDEALALARPRPPAVTAPQPSEEAAA